MRRVIYGGAMSLDGYIAGPHGEYDWILMDPEIDFAGMAARFDTYLIGRKTFDQMRRMEGEAPAMPGTRSIVCSRTLRQSDHPSVTISPDAERDVAELRTKPGKGVARLEERQKAHFIDVGPTEWETIGRELEEENA